ncbi:MAG: hypothetical protein M3376_04845 [Actinomycetota bacterium]|nr:hypothetical protein [Actinomycetota bacterium]
MPEHVPGGVDDAAGDGEFASVHNCMAAIVPFRHLIVYPPLMGEIERDWRASAGDLTPAHA